MEKSKNQESERVLLNDIFLSLTIWAVVILRRDIYELLIVPVMFDPTCIFALIPHALMTYAIGNVIVRIGIIGTSKAVFVTHRIPHFFILVATIVLCTTFWKPLGYTYDIFNFQLNRAHYEDLVENIDSTIQYRNVSVMGVDRDILLIHYKPFTSYCYFPEKYTSGDRVDGGSYLIHAEVNLGKGWYICYSGRT